MDRLTKAFVIAASSVVIAVGGTWLYRQIYSHIALERCISDYITYEDSSAKDSAFPHFWLDKTAEEKRDSARQVCVDKLKAAGVFTQ